MYAQSHTKKHTEKHTGPLPALLCCYWLLRVKLMIVCSVNILEIPQRETISRSLDVRLRYSGIVIFFFFQFLILFNTNCLQSNYDASTGLLRNKPSSALNWIWTLAFPFFEQLDCEVQEKSSFTGPSEFPWRITLWPLQLYLVRLFNGPRPKLLMSMNHLYIHICKQKAQVLKYQNSPSMPQ